MQIGYQYGAAFQSGTPIKSGVNKTAVDASEKINPTSVRINSDAINSIPKQGIDNQGDKAGRRASGPPQVADKPPRQQPSSDFDFAKAASSGVNDQTVYDKPSGANRFAIDSYQQIVNGPKREEIQRLVGIDTFA